MGGGELKRRFGRRIQSLREAKGLTQEQLAERIGRSVDTVGNIERGVNATRIEVAYRIAVELGVSLPELFALEGEPVPGRHSGQPAEGRARVALGELLDGCDEDTAVALLDLVRVGLKLTAPR